MSQDSAVSVNNQADELTQTTPIVGAQQEYDGVAVMPETAGAKQNIDPFHFQPPMLPTQEGPMGIKYDFNDGARIMFPPGQWHARIIDEESGNILFACDPDAGGWVVSSKKYYVPFRLMVWQKGQNEPILDHVMNLKDQPVRICFPVGTLGDLIGWFPYVARFQQKHGCRLECTMGQNIIELFQDQYPSIKFAVPGEHKIKAPYATYRVGLFFGGNNTNQPIDFRLVGLHRTAGYILGVDPSEEPPLLKLDHPRTIKEPYVCIATKATGQAKHWNNGFGWSEVIGYLKDQGYRVLCIDRERIIGSGYVWNQFPHGAEDFTGNLPLSQRIALLQHADFFIGLSSGLSWLAWSCRIPVVMISGFSLPMCEFNTPHRVFNSHGCYGCWDDVKENFSHDDFFWCPRQKGTERMFECTRLITGKQVVSHIERCIADIKRDAG